MRAGIVAARNKPRAAIAHRAQRRENVVAAGLRRIVGRANQNKIVAHNLAPIDAAAVGDKRRFRRRRVRDCQIDIAALGQRQRAPAADDERQHLAFAKRFESGQKPRQQAGVFDARRRRQANLRRLRRPRERLAKRAQNRDDAERGFHIDSFARRRAKNARNKSADSSASGARAIRA